MMNYKNPVSRFILRKDFFKRVKMRLSLARRKLTKNEFNDFEYLYKLLNQRPKTIFDCGANIGFVSYQFHKIFPSAEIHSFEPNPDVFDSMSKHLSGKDKIFKYNCGIGKVNDVIKFYKNRNTGTSSFLTPNDFHKAHMAKSFETIEVPIISIDVFCKDEQIEKIDILKLDIEGYELDALIGAESLIKNNLVDFIYAEVNLVPTYQNQPCIEDIISYCRSNNYYPFNFYGQNETKYKECIITNILFISGSIARKINEKIGKNAVYQSE